MIESSLTEDSNWSSNQRTEARGAGFANPVVSSKIWSSLQQENNISNIINFAMEFLNCAYGVI